MKHTVICIILVWCSLAVCGQVTYQQEDSLTVCRLLQQAPSDAGTLWFARQLLGRPYVAHTLEVNSEEQLVVNTRELDCTTLVETVTALTWCHQHGWQTWEHYLTVLRQLRYRQGLLQGYPSRLHYFSDWIGDNEQLRFVTEIQAPQPPFTALQHVRVNYMSSHPQAYRALTAHPEWVETIRHQEDSLSALVRRYIPKSSVVNSQLLRQTVHDGDIIAITCNKKGLDIAHLGFAVWQRDGLHLLNASQLHKKVVEEPMTFYRYLQKHPSHTGIRVVRINRNHQPTNSQ